MTLKYLLSWVVCRIWGAGKSGRNFWEILQVWFILYRLRNETSRLQADHSFWKLWILICTFSGGGCQSMPKWICCGRTCWLGCDLLICCGSAEMLGPQLGRDLRSGRGHFGVERCWGQVVPVGSLGCSKTSLRLLQNDQCWDAIGNVFHSPKERKIRPFWTDVYKLFVLILKGIS